MAHPTARLLHSLVFMGASLTGGGALFACGGISGDPLAGDSGVEAGDANPDQYPAIHADGYAHIGIAIPDTGTDHYATIHPADTGADGYPVISADTGHDGYPIIYPAEPDAYPTIGIDAGPDGPYPVIGPPPAGDA